MAKNTIYDLAPKKRHAVIGMLHVPALPGAPLARTEFAKIKDFVLRDAKSLRDGGVDCLMMENFGDVPFFPGRVPAHVVALMTALACDVKDSIDLPLGINVLRNDGMSALAVAVASGADFIRVNVLTGARVTDQGVIQGIAHDLLRYRSELNANHIKILADIDVKHSAPVAPRPFKDEVEDTIKRALADAVIVSGAGTGKPINAQTLADVVAAAGETPVILGSGVSGANICDFKAKVWGFIVGTSLKKDGRVENPVDVRRVKELMKVLD
jgi:membrane complex biogenesis BtpA family protein